MTTLDDIAIHKSERALLLGGTGTGKSTLGEYLIQHFVAEFPRGRVLILDSKPRMRAEWLPDGTSAARRYRRWDHGTVIAGSMAVHLDGNPKAALRNVWTHGVQIAIAQALEGAADRHRLIAVLEAFNRSARASRPQLVFIDETLDFFHGNGSPIGGSDAILWTFRGGREKGVSAAAGSQRGKGIPIQLRSELSQFYGFKLDHLTDVRECYEFGFPRGSMLPTEDFEFVWWHKKKQRQPMLCQLNLPH